MSKDNPILNKKKDKSLKETDLRGLRSFGLLDSDHHVLLLVAEVSTAAAHPSTRLRGQQRQTVVFLPVEGKRHAVRDSAHLASQDMVLAVDDQ